MEKSILTDGQHIHKTAGVAQDSVVADSVIAASDGSVRTLISRKDILSSRSAAPWWTGSAR